MPHTRTTLDQVRAIANAAQQTNQTDEQNSGDLDVETLFSFTETRVSPPITAPDTLQITMVGSASREDSNDVNNLSNSRPSATEELQTSGSHTTHSQ